MRKYLLPIYCDIFVISSKTCNILLGEAAARKELLGEQNAHTMQESLGVPMDTEVSEVLFHFDTIVTELEKATLTPRSVTPSDPSVRTPTPNQERRREILITPDLPVLPGIGSEGVRVGGGEGGRERREGRVGDQGRVGEERDEGVREGEGEGEIAREAPPKSVQPKFKVQDIKQQFLQNVQRDTTAVAAPRPQEAVPPPGGDKVKGIIAQMMQVSSSSRESSPSPAPEKEPSEVSPGKQGRQRSSSISQRISMLTHVSGENDVFEKKESAVVVVPSSRRILQITQDFEKKKKKEGEGERRPGGGPGRRKRRSSSASKSSSASRSDDSPKILSPPKSSSKRSVAQENGVPPAITTKRPGAAPSVVMETYTSLESEIEEGLGEARNASSSDAKSGQASDTKTQEESSVCEKVEDVEKVKNEESATKRSESSSSTETASERVCVAPAAPASSVSNERELTKHSGTAQCETVAVGDSRINDDVAAKSTILETSSETATATQAERTQKRTALRKPASVSSLASGSVAMRTESMSSSDVMLSPAMDGSYRFRSVSDVSHDTRKLSSYCRDGSVSSGSMREMDGDSKVSATYLHMYIQCVT